MSMKCPFCRAEIPDDSWFCDQCGKELHFCPECGKPKQGTKCAACGSTLVDAEHYFKPAEAGPASPQKLYLVSDGVKIEVKEGVFGRTQGVCPELSSDVYVSRLHGEFRLNGGVWQIRDLGSTNGTCVDGRRLNKDEWADLAPGQTVKIAVTSYKIEP